MRLRILSPSRRARRGHGGSRRRRPGAPVRIAARLGAEGVRLQKLARGAGSRPLRPVEPELVFEQSLELEYPVTEMEPLSFTLSRLLHELCRSLESRALAAIEIRMVLKLENQAEHKRAIRLPVPMRDIMIL